MTPERIVEMTEKYEEVLRRIGTQPVEVDKALVSPNMSKAFQHVMWMMPEVRKIVAAGKKDKAERWLCWAQGVMWFSGFFSINDQREHNRTPDPEVQIKTP